jgi:nucleotide-binding universal stress UspA family protein
MSLRHLIVATDFSPIADAALDRAMAIAKLHGARVTLVYAETVVDAGPISDDEGTVTAELGALAAALKDDERRELDLRLDKIRGHGITVDTAVRPGPPDETIAALAEYLEADLIVIGTHGRTGVTRFLLGSVAERVVRSARCDVLVSRGENGIFSKPLVGTDFSPASERALVSTMNLVGPDVPIRVVHAWQYPVGSWGLGLLGGHSRAASTVRDAITRTAEEHGAKLLAAHRRDGHPLSFELAEGSPADVITDIATRDGHDLVAIGTHGLRTIERLLLGSVAEKAVRHAHCSVLIARYLAPPSPPSPPDSGSPES